MPWTLTLTSPDGTIIDTLTAATQAEMHQQIVATKDDPRDLTITVAYRTEEQ